MKLEDLIREKMADGTLANCPSSFQGVGKPRIREVLRVLARETEDMIDGVFSLLDDEQPSWFSKAGTKLRFSDGASTAHIACHVGIYQRGKNKLDREGRDYWLKPLWQIGALEKVTYQGDGTFVVGHPVPKSPGCAYRIASDFLVILKLPAEALAGGLSAWNSAEATRSRLARQAAVAEAAKQSITSHHEQLIEDIRQHYAPQFLPGFEVVYVDDSDGERVSEDEKKSLGRAGLVITLADSMPDVLLWNPSTDWLWIVEAVCSDGEVDFHKVNQLVEFAKRNGKKDIGFTTAYPDWKTAAARQQKMKNLAADSYLWIREDASKQMRISSFAVET